MTHCGWKIFKDDDKLIAKKWGARMSVDINGNIDAAKRHLEAIIKKLRDQQISLKERKRRKYTQREIQALAGTPLPLSAVVDIAERAYRHD
ncbi:MAG: hypothetical protein HOJ58_07675 [Chloroflexi bacterium]|jgi:hypothetical protein|nr:hypothetical protein [Chloroflexota bacterium]